jgi:hypothetical protein
LLEPWVGAADMAPALARELAAEAGPGHPLFGAGVAALARRLDRDDAASRRCTMPPCARCPTRCRR